MLGPTVREGAIAYDEIASESDLPAGWTDEQAPGRYRLRRRADAALFGYAVGPHSWKRFLHPPRERLWRLRKNGDRIEAIAEPESAPREAFLGVRACELAAIGILDRVLGEGELADARYRARRSEAFVVAVNCAVAASTCFCVSMGTGPRARSGYDLALTELLDERGHVFVVEAGSERGAELLAELPVREASEAEIAQAAAQSERTAAAIGRRLDTAGAKDLLQSNPEHPRWDEVAKRCLACGNCTQVCPTCFCSTMEDTADLSGETAERWRRWDSCYTLDFSYVHGGPVRRSVKARYRQWLTHKLAHWIEQFGTSGCVGCGRCIAWCPVGIDLTEEVAAIRALAAAKETS
ncbi:MAG: 4Fe-4S dicluster domain-containing protein [Burkholderiales bacterium]|nr:4Fe-4S dicluster domain-containing protein [Burkholderiales bacterium]